MTSPNKPQFSGSLFDAEAPAAEQTATGPKVDLDDAQRAIEEFAASHGDLGIDTSTAHEDGIIKPAAEAPADKPVADAHQGSLDLLEAASATNFTPAEQTTRPKVESTEPDNVARIPGGKKRMPPASSAKHDESEKPAGSSREDAPWQASGDLSEALAAEAAANEQEPAPESETTSPVPEFLDRAFDREDASSEQGEQGSHGGKMRRLGNAALRLAKSAARRQYPDIKAARERAAEAHRSAQSSEVTDTPDSSESAAKPELLMAPNGVYQYSDEDEPREGTNYRRQPLPKAPRKKVPLKNRIRNLDNWLRGPENDAKPNDDQPISDAELEAMAMNDDYEATSGDLEEELKAAARAESTPDVDTDAEAAPKTKKSLLERATDLKNSVSLTGNKLIIAMIPGAPAKEFLTDERTVNGKTERRLNRSGYVAAAAAAGVVALLSYKGINMISHIGDATAQSGNGFPNPNDTHRGTTGSVLPHDTHPGQTPPTDQPTNGGNKPNHWPTDKPVTTHPGEEVPPRHWPGQEHMPQVVDDVHNPASAHQELHSAKGMWGQSADYLKANGYPASPHNMALVANGAREMAGMSNYDASHMRFGTEFHFPAIKDLTGLKR